MITDGKSLGFQANDNKKEELQKQKIQLGLTYMKQNLLFVYLYLILQMSLSQKNYYSLRKQIPTRGILILWQNLIMWEILSKGWNYTLRQLIKRYKEALHYQPQEEYLEKNKPITYHTVYQSSSRRMVEEEFEKARSIQRNIEYPLTLVTCLKCHYCNLDFEDVKARKEHELEWHI